MAITSILRDERLLLPPFLHELNQGIALARADGHPVRIFETYRTPARQHKLWEQGRETKGPIVTQSRAWQSWHQYGVAADIALFKDGKWSWAFDPAKMARYFEGLNIKWGGANDGPHYQYSKLPLISAAQAIVAENNGILAFWATLLT
jgi:D-alanyl-D-alanine dipeptidase